MQYTLHLQIYLHLYGLLSEQVSAFRSKIKRIRHFTKCTKKNTVAKKKRLFPRDFGIVIHCLYLTDEN